MTLFYYDPLFVEHQTSAGHPEKPSRVAETYRRLEPTKVLERCKRGSATPISRSAVREVHSEPMVAAAEQLCRQGTGYVDGDTPVSARSLDAALLAAGCGIAAVDAVIGGEEKTAFCLVRPPGHHATPDRSMGFCLINNIALAARRAIDKHGLSRVLIVDWDVHHGNGTQDCFYEDPRVLFFSAHRFPFYPGTGKATETGAGPGLGFTVNMPVAYGTPVKDYIGRFRNLLEDAADKMKPELVLISAGFDAHRQDPIGSLDLETEDFITLGKLVQDIAKTHSNGRIVSLLEGGYNVPILGQCVEQHIGLLLDG